MTCLLCYTYLVKGGKGLIMVISVNEDIRETVFLQLRRKKLTQKELAKAIGMNEMYLSHLLTGNREGGRETWEKILDHLDLKLTATPKSDA